MNMRFFQKIRHFFDFFFRPSPPLASKWELDLYSAALQRSVHLTFLHSGQEPPQALLLLNDGQDLPALQMEHTLQRLFAQRTLPPLLIAAIHAGDRMQEYGTAHQPDYAKRGSRAAAYESFVIQELLPHIYQHYLQQSRIA